MTAAGRRLGYRPPARPLNGPARARPAAARRAVAPPAPYPTKRGRGTRVPRTFGERVSTGAAAEVRHAVRTSIRLGTVAGLVTLALAVGCVARLTGYLPDPTPVPTVTAPR